MSVAEPIQNLPANAVGNVAVTPETWQFARDIYLADPWEFARDIMGMDLLVERFHRPLIYLMEGKFDLLVSILKGESRACEGMGCCAPGPLKSAVIDEIYRGLRERGLSVHVPADLPAIRDLLHNVNIRIARKMGKTSCGEVAITHDITADPNQAWMLVSRDDPAAWEMCDFIGSVILSDAYRAFFPDRIPENARNNITQKSILLDGRTKTLPQPCVTANGVASGWVSKHFTRGYKDDLVGMENRAPAKLKVVRDFQSNQAGLMIPEVGYKFHDVTTGTRWAKEDDSYIPERDDSCLTIYVPVEILKDKDGNAVPRTFENMMDAGEPTLPEWYDEDKIAVEKMRYMRNPEEGPVALLANMLLTVEEQASALFPPLLVDRAQYITPQAGSNLVGRPATTQSGEKILNATGKQKLYVWNPMTDLARKMGVDPAVEVTGDEWGITILGRDRYGVKFQLETLSGRGIETLVQAMKTAQHKWRCEEIGVEKAAQQGLVTFFLNKDEDFRRMAMKLTPVPHGGHSKDSRNDMYVATPLRTGDLLLNPSSANNPLRRQMKDYTRNNRNGKDGMVDSLSIAMSMFDTAASGVSVEDIKRSVKAEKLEYEQSVDKQLGIVLEPLFDQDGDVWGFN